MDLKEQHDELLARKPSGIEHDADQCPFCSEEGGDMSSITYTEDELKAAVAAAIAPLQAELDKHAASQEAEAVAAKIEEALKPLQDEVASLQTQLDTATLRAETAEKNHADLVAWLEGEAEAAEAAKVLEARRGERIAQVKEAAAFSDEYIAGAIDRWVAMADEDFSALLDDWKAVAAKKAPEGDSLPSATAMVAARETEGGDAFADVRELARLRLKGVDIRTL